MPTLLTPTETAQVRLLLDLARRCEAARPDAKAERLVDLIYSRRGEENDPDLKFLIFTEFVPTQQMLTEYLTARGFSVVCLNGSMDMDERRRTQQAFATHAQVMISTEAGGEGLNLQFCHTAINYDLPWNPMRIEQRIGRVDRIGQTHDVMVYNMVFSGTIEQRVHEVLLEKLLVILNDLGFDKFSDVLDSSEAGRGFEDLFIRAILDPTSTDDYLDTFVATIQEQARQERQTLSSLLDQPLLSAGDVRTTPSPLPPSPNTSSSRLSGLGGEAGTGIQGLTSRWPDGPPSDWRHLCSRRRRGPTTPAHRHRPAVGALPHRIRSLTRPTLPSGSPTSPARSGDSGRSGSSPSPAHRATPSLPSPTSSPRPAGPSRSPHDRSGMPLPGAPTRSPAHRPPNRHSATGAGAVPPIPAGRQD
ncbi:helicase-related protein [Methanoculleus sp. 10]|uniref:DEAD/DEAH box helicase n=1 Tax=Methanoculleus sp. 10 TaxID=430615 RepID=UPI0025FF34B5|nr:helicase-related protein [Methanoculleus sp. 10]